MLCTRVRLEEKRLIAALAGLGVAVSPLPPSDSPLPIGPLAASAVGGDHTGSASTVVIDRLQERDLAAVLLPYWRQAGQTVIDAGMAATMDRLAVARTLADAGMPRPETALVVSEEAGLAAITEFGGAGTLLPLRASGAELPLHDRETAEAVLEHRQVLGDAPASISLLQRGLAGAGNRLSVVVVDGQAATWEGTRPDTVALEAYVKLAEATSRVLGARLIGITMTAIGSSPVVWDVSAVPAFRDATPIAGVTVEARLAELVGRMIEGPAELGAATTMLMGQEAHDHVVLSA